MMKTAIAFAAALFALVAIPEYASAHQPCGWKRNHYGQRVWVCTQQPAAHYYRRNPPRAYRQSVVVAVPVYAPVQRYNVPIHGQICPQTGQVLAHNVVPQHAVSASLNPGFPGGGYVQGAPRSPQECLQRGGFDTGQGCRGYR